MTARFDRSLATSVTPTPVTNEQKRHQMIERAVHATTDNHGSASMVLWERLAAALTLIIGVRGFSSLFLRSLSEASAQFAWLESQSLKAGSEGLHLLTTILQTRVPAEGQAANAAILKVFIDTLIVLIGEPVVNNILCSAWGNDIVNDSGADQGK